MSQKQKNDKGVGIKSAYEVEVESGKSRRPYSVPHVISAEGLEAMAAACNPPAFGKSSGDGCGPPNKPLGS